MNTEKKTPKIVPTWLGLLIIIGALWLVLRLVTGGEAIQGAYVDPETRENNRQKAEIRRARLDAERFVRKALRDGESARFELVSAKYQGGVILVCGNVNAKNGFGAYNGFRPFIYSTANGIAFFAEMMESPQSFEQAWVSACN